MLRKSLSAAQMGLEGPDKFMEQKPFLGLLNIITSKECLQDTNNLRLKSYSRKSIMCTCPILPPFDRLLLLAPGLAGLLV